MAGIIERWLEFRSKATSLSAIWTLVLFTKSYAAFQICISVLVTTLNFSKPFFINRLLVFIQNKKPDDDWTHGLMLLLGMFICSMAQHTLESQIDLSSRHWGISLRAILVYEIFKKSLRRAAQGGVTKAEQSGKRASQGKIVNLMSSDANQLRSFLVDIHELIIEVPLSVIISISGLIAVMGTPALAGLVVLIITGPFSAWAMKNVYLVLKKTRALVDARIQATNEALQGIRIIKYMAWEPQFIKKIWQAREDEINSRLKLMLSNMVVYTIPWVSSILVTFTSFFFYTVSPVNLDCRWSSARCRDCFH